MAEEKTKETTQEEVKEEPKKQEAPKKKEEAKPKPKTKKAQPKKKATPMVHIDDFLGTVSGMIDLNPMQKAGFKAYMRGKVYQKDYNTFNKYLEEYLDI